MKSAAFKKHSITRFIRKKNVFESIVEKVIVGGYDETGNADPSMITFVYKTGFEDRKNGDDYKPPRKNSKAKKLPSLPENENNVLPQTSKDVACGDRSHDVKSERVKEPQKA